METALPYPALEFLNVLSYRWMTVVKVLFEGPLFANMRRGSTYSCAPPMMPVTMR